MNWNFLTDKYGFKLETVGDAGLVYSKALLNEFYIDINIEQHSYCIDLYKHNIIYFREIHNDNESDYVLTLINKIQEYELTAKNITLRENISKIEQDFI